jgi:hypothetical protein
MAVLWAKVDGSACRGMGFPKFGGFGAGGMYPAPMAFEMQKQVC